MGSRTKVDVDDHEQVEHGAQYGHPGLRERQREPRRHGPQRPHVGNSHVASSTQTLRASPTVDEPGLILDQPDPLQRRLCRMSGSPPISHGSEQRRVSGDLWNARFDLARG